MPDKCISQNHIWICKNREYHCTKCNKIFKLGIFGNEQLHSEPTIADIASLMSCRNGACQI